MMNPQSENEAVPYRRWFYYLLIGSLLALLLPFFADKGSRIHTPSLQLYVEESGSLKPAEEKIWFDGHLASLLNSRAWVWTAVGFVALEFLIWGSTVAVRRIRRSQRKAINSPASLVRR